MSVNKIVYEFSFNSKFLEENRDLWQSFFDTWQLLRSELEIEQRSNLPNKKAIELLKIEIAQAKSLLENRLKKISELQLKPNLRIIKLSNET